MEKEKFLKTLRSMGLKKRKVFKNFKMWAVNWPDPLRTFDEALEACGKLGDFSFLKYCEPNALSEPLSEDSDLYSSGGFFIAETTRVGENKRFSSKDGVNNIRTCGVVSQNRSLDGGRLSDYWAQEMIGSDLLKEELIKTPPPTKRNFVAVFDVEFENGSHADRAGNLVSDNGDHSVLPEIGRKKSYYRTRLPEEFVEVAEKINRSGAFPSFINNSMSWDSSAIVEAFHTLSPPSVIVAGSGNDYGNNRPVTERQSKASGSFDLILVGAFSPKGFASDYSSEGSEVHILAPSSPTLEKPFLTSADQSGEIASFGGTSGAAPLVTGSLAGFEWLSGYHPSSSESKELLERTALPTVHSYESPRRNGVGLLNSYKLGMVGKRLKEKCQNKDSGCFQKEIKNPSNYQFTVDKSLESEVSRVFPSCPLSGKKRGGGGGDCSEMERVFNNLRKAVLLNPERRDLWDSLGCVYRGGGFHGNSEGLDRLALASSSREEAIRDLEAYLKPVVELSDHKKHRHPDSEKYFRLNKNLALMDRAFLERLSRGSEYDKIDATVVAGIIGGPKEVSLLKILAKDKSEYVRDWVARSARRIGGTEGDNILKLLDEDN